MREKLLYISELKTYFPVQNEHLLKLNVLKKKLYACKLYNIHHYFECRVIIQMLFSCSSVWMIWVNVVCVLRHVGTDYLFCDCQLRWLLSWIRSQAVRVGNESVCVYPTRLHGLELRSLQEQQLTCGKTSLMFTSPHGKTHYLQGSKKRREFSKNEWFQLMTLCLYVFCVYFSIQFTQIH